LDRKAFTVETPSSVTPKIRSIGEMILARALSRAMSGSALM